MSTISPAMLIDPRANDSAHQDRASSPVPSSDDDLHDQPKIESDRRSMVTRGWIPWTANLDRRQPIRLDIDSPRPTARRKLPGVGVPPPVDPANPYNTTPSNDAALSAHPTHISASPFPPRTHYDDPTCPEVEDLDQKTNSAGQRRTTTTPPTRTPKAKAKQICSFWIRGGCNRGDVCRFVHGPERPVVTVTSMTKKSYLQRKQQIHSDISRALLEFEAQMVRQEEERRILGMVENLLARQTERVREAQEKRQREEEEERERARQEETERLRKEMEEERQRRLEEAQAKKMEEANATQTTIIDGSIVTFAAGLDIVGLIPSFDVCSVTLRQLPECTTEDITKLLCDQLGFDQGTTYHIHSLRPDRAAPKRLFATIFMKRDEAGVLPFATEGLTIHDQATKVEVREVSGEGRMGSFNHRESETCLTISWSLPSLSAIVTFASTEELEKKITELNNLDTLVLGRKLRAAKNPQPTGPAARYWNPISLKMTNVPPTIDSDVVATLVYPGSPRIMPKSPKYDLESVIQTLKTQLYQEFHAVEGSFETTQDECRVQAKVKFSSYDDADRALQAIKEKRIVSFPNLFPTLPRRYNFGINIPRKQYETQKRVWDELSAVDGDKGLAFLQVKPAGGPSNDRVFIKVLGSDNKKVGMLKARVEALASGERLDASYWHSAFLSVAGKELAELVHDQTSAFAFIDRRNHLIRLFGDARSIGLAKALVHSEVDKLNSLQWSEKLPGRSLGRFLQQGLAIVEEAAGKENVVLDVKSREIRVQGGDDIRKLLRRLVQDASDATLKVNGSVEPQNPASCPICYGEPTTAALLCGHAYCHICLQHYLISAIGLEQFPLTCMGDDAQCHAPIPIPDIQRFLPEGHFSRLQEAAFKTYIHTHPTIFKHCPTPDCRQIYRCDTVSAKPGGYKCPSCLHTVCSGCNEPSHAPMTCDEARVARDPKEQERLSEEWFQANGVKKCPGCTALVFKDGGCNHMQCGHCKAHFCWLCVEVFTDVYAHLESVHGGIGV